MRCALCKRVSSKRNIETDSQFDLVIGEDMPRVRPQSSLQQLKKPLSFFMILAVDEKLLGRVALPITESAQPEQV
jgi:hypothetical protein